MAIPIIFQAVNINQMDTNSSFMIGQNYESNILSTRKQNYGSGANVGITLVTGIFSYIMDSDLIDATVNSPNISSPTAQSQLL